MNNKPIDKLMLLLVASVIVVLALLNLVQPNRPTISQEENRTLAAWPEFKAADIASGKYFSDIGAFFSDTFFGREAMVNLSKRLDKFKGLFDDDFSVIIHPNPTNPAEPEDETLPTLPPLVRPTAPTTEPTLPPTVPGVDPTDPPVIPVLLSSQKVSLTAGTTHLLTATLGDGCSGLAWASDNTAVLSVTDNGDGTATVKGLAAGTAGISATVEDQNGLSVSVLCVFTVTAPPQVSIGGAEFIPDSSMFIYDGAAYVQSYYTTKATPMLAEIYDRFAQLFPSSRVSVMVAPLGTITIRDTEVNKKIKDQGAILDKIEAAMPDSIHYVNLKNTFLAHADEYLYFKSDHHWTQRGAYYAYSEFIKSVGMTPRPLEDFEVKVLNKAWTGDMYRFTKDERVKEFKDTVEAFIPSKACVMEIFDGEKWLSYNYCINLKRTNFLAFLNGEWGYSIIHVPENPQDKTILVMKDSYGNSFVPFLTEHYGTIIVVDARHVELDALETFGNMNISDILFINDTSSMSTTFYKHYLKMVD